MGIVLASIVAAAVSFAFGALWYGPLFGASWMKLMKMKKMLRVESGVARSERKRGISVPKEKLTQPLLFVGAEKGTSLPFGIGIEKMRNQAEYYKAPVVEIRGASHPGLLIGKHWKKSAKAIFGWLKENNL